MEKIPEILIKMLEEQYDEETVNNVLEGYSKDKVVTLRVNTLKTTVDEIKNILDVNKIKYKDVKWSKQALIIENVKESKLQELEIYKQGKIYLQSLSSMLPPIILNPEENTDILDMAAAPGGKTTQIAALTNNNANITACEMNNIRMERLKYNIEKQGATSVYTMQIDSRKMDDFFSFDNILLDAPCSGSGTINSKDKNLNKILTKILIDKCIKTQKELIKKAIKLLKPGCEMIYSTCSILSCENEEIIKIILENKNIELVPIEFEGMEELPLLPTKIKGTLLVCPTEKYEGFFIAKLKRMK